MSKERLGNDPMLEWIKSTNEPTMEQSVKIKEGRKTKNTRVLTKTSQEGLKEDYTRATFIVHESLLEKLKDYAYTERRAIKDIINEMLEGYLKDKKTIKRRER